MTVTVMFEAVLRRADAPEPSELSVPCPVRVSGHFTDDIAAGAAEGAKPPDSHVSDNPTSKRIAAPSACDSVAASSVQAANTSTPESAHNVPRRFILRNSFFFFIIHVFRYFLYPRRDIQPAAGKFPRNRRPSERRLFTTQNLFCSIIPLF